MSGKTVDARRRSRAAGARRRAREERPNPNCPSPIGPCICGPKKKKPDPTYRCSVCGLETQHERYAYGREIIERDHENVRDCVRQLLYRIQDLEGRMP